MVIATVVLMSLAMIFLGNSLGIIKLDFADPMNLVWTLFIVSIVLLTYFTVSMIMKVLVSLKIMTE